MRPIALWLALALGFVVTVAPAQQPETVIASSFVRPAAGALVLILPADAELAELQPGIQPLLSALGAQLSAAGYKAALLERANHELLWAQEAEAVGGVFDSTTGALKQREFAQALATLSVRLAKETSAKLVLMPRLVSRQAELHGSKAAWDARLELLPSMGGFGGGARGRGVVPAISVQLLALTDQGELAFRSFGGVALPYAVNFVTERAEFRHDLFRSAADVSKGVELALRPLIAK